MDPDRQHQRDPFEGAVGEEQKTKMSIGDALAGPVTSYLYDWNLLPYGQLLWLKELETYQLYPPLQAPRVLQPKPGLSADQE